MEKRRRDEESEISLLSGRTVLLLGHTDVGKSLLFSHLTCASPLHETHTLEGVVFDEAPIAPRRRRRLRDLFAGLHRELAKNKTADVPTKKGPGDRAISAPVVANLFGPSAEARATRRLLLSGRIDTILLVADAKRLQRSIALFLQAAEFGIPLVLDLNMMDEARSRGIRIAIPKLAKILGVEVNPTVAIMGKGLPSIPALLKRARPSSAELDLPKRLRTELNEMREVMGPRLVSQASQGPSAPAPETPSNPKSRGLALSLLAGDTGAVERLDEALLEEQKETLVETVERARRSSAAPLGQIVAERSYAQAERIARRVMSSATPEPELMQRLGRLATHRYWGVPIAMAVLFAAYMWVGWLGAGVVVDLLDQKLLKGVFLPLSEKALQPIPWEIVREAFIDPDFGLIPTGIFLALGIVTPVLLFFNILFLVLEESGYLARLSVLLDRSLRRIGLNGRGVLPLVLGFSCVTMALLTTRTLKSKKERLIASLLLVGLPCAPLLAVTLVVLQPLSPAAPAVFFALIFARVLIFGFLANKTLPGVLPDFIMELPTMRRPDLVRVMNQSLARTIRFLAEALPIFMLASLVLFALDRLGGLTVLENISVPIVKDLLGLPNQAVQVFIKTIIRRENGAAELALVRGHFNGVQLLVTLLVMTFIFPCINAAIVLVKEQGLKAAMLIMGLQVLVALGTGALFYRVCLMLGASF